jgi:hypothetical protein
MPNSSLSDAELVAIETCLNALRPLTEEARSRALAYLNDRINAELTASNGDKGGNHQ